MARQRLTVSVSSGRCRSRVWPGLHRQAGMTIVELVLVIVIIAILGALAGPRFFNNRDFAERAYAEELGSALRYAQKIAIGSGCRVRVDIAANSYTLSQQAPQAGHCNPADATFPVAVQHPGGASASGVAPSGVTAAPVSTVTFDALGQSNLGATLAIAVGPHSFTVQAGSGLVQGP